LRSLPKAAIKDEGRESTRPLGHGAKKIMSKIGGREGWSALSTCGCRPHHTILRPHRQPARCRCATRRKGWSGRASNSQSGRIIHAILREDLASAERFLLDHLRSAEQTFCAIVQQFRK